MPPSSACRPRWPNRRAIRCGGRRSASRSTRPTCPGGSGSPRSRPLERLGPHDNYSVRGVRPGVFAGSLAGAAIDHDPIDIANRRALVERVNLDPVDVPLRVALRCPYHDGRTLELRLIALDANAADRTQCFADGVETLLFYLIPAEVGAQLALAAPLEVCVPGHEGLGTRLHDDGRKPIAVEVDREITGNRR